MADMTLVDKKIKRVRFRYVFDTWGSPKNYDKLITNIFRAISILILMYLVSHDVRSWVWFIMMPVVWFFAGVTEIRFFQNKKEKIEISCW